MWPFGCESEKKKRSVALSKEMTRVISTVNGFVVLDVDALMERLKKIEYCIDEIERREDKRPHTLLLNGLISRLEILEKHIKRRWWYVP